MRDDIRDDDAEALEETINRDLVRPFIDLNFGPQQQYPEVQLRVAEKRTSTPWLMPWRSWYRSA